MHKSVRNEHLPDLRFAISRFSRVVFILRAQPHTISFLFPIILGINLIHFLDGKKDGAAGNSIACFGSSPDHLSLYLREAERRVRSFWQRKVWTLRHLGGEELGGTKVQIFGKGKCNLIANRPFSQLWPGNEVRGIAGENRLRCACFSFELSFFFCFGMSFSDSLLCSSLFQSRQG